MPKKLERKLEAEARKDGLRRGSARYNAYVYGTERKIERATSRKRRASDAQATRKRRARKRGK
jgi:hypothetical protein